MTLYSWMVIPINPGSGRSVSNSCPMDPSPASGKLSAPNVVLAKIVDNLNYDRIKKVRVTKLKQELILAVAAHMVQVNVMQMRIVTKDDIVAFGTDFIQSWIVKNPKQVLKAKITKTRKIRGPKLRKIPLRNWHLQTDTVKLFQEFITEHFDLSDELGVKFRDLMIAFNSYKKVTTQQIWSPCYSELLAKLKITHDRKVDPALTAIPNYIGTRYLGLQVKPGSAHVLKRNVVPVSNP